MRWFYLASIATLAIVAGLARDSHGADAVRVLIVTGVDPVGHDWRESGPALRKVLEKDGRIEARIVEEPAFLASAAAADYDVIVLDFKDVSAEDTAHWGWQVANDKLPSHMNEVRQNLSNLVRNGKGLVVLHFASGAFLDWPEFKELAGKVWNRDVHSHDPRGPFTVKIVEPKHPIMQGMQDFQADDELFICLKGDRPVEVLATARSTLTGKDHPMAFVFECGKGRVFHTPLGHDVRAIEMPGVAELLRRGCVWAAGRQP
jgi:type 1 glutamine amidotransferase